MADILGELVVQITGDTSQFDRSINNTEKRTSKAAASLRKTAGTFSKVAAAGIAAIGVASVKFASDLGESINAVNVVFGQSADVIQDWGETAAEQAGLSKAAFNESSALIGTLLKKTGKDLDNVALDTIEVTKRSADLASVFNKDLSVATNAVAAALRGETEPIRAFAIDVSAAAVEAEALSSGLVRNKKDITESIKVQARYNLILKQSKDVAGDFSNTNDQVANSARVLKAELENAGAELGETFLPIVSKSVVGLVKFTRAAKELAPEVGERLTEAWFQVSAAVETAVVKLSGLFNLQIKFFGAIIEQSINLGKVLVKPFITIVAVIAKVFATILNESSKFGASIQETFVVAVNNVKLAFISLGATIINEALGAVQKFLDATTKIPIIGERFRGASNAVRELSGSFEEASDEAIKQQKAVVEAAEKEKKAAELLYIEKLEGIESEKTAKLEALRIDRENREAEKQREAEERADRLSKIRENEQSITNAKLQANEEYRLKLLELSETEFERLEREKEEAIERAREQGQTTFEIEQFFAKKKADLEKKANIERIRTVQQTSNSIAGIIQGLQQIELNAIETSKNSRIEALDREQLGEEEYAKRVKEIEKDAAEESWRLQKEQLAAQKAASLIEIATNTAIGVSKALAQGGILGIASGALVAAAGAVQTGVVLSQPEPPRPQLNTGAVVAPTQSGIPVTVGENNQPELILGGGAKGEPLLNDFADKVADRIGISQIVVNQNNLLNLQDTSKLEQVADLLIDPLENAKQRRGI